MADNELAGVGVLVTRPRHQAVDLIAAITKMGGSVVELPAIEIVPRASDAIAEDVRRSHDPDIAILVSANAVRHGLAHAGAAKIAAIGPATAAAIESAGHDVDIRSPAGYDSEHLLVEPELQDVGEKIVRIIRGDGGRELIAETLRDRGAIVEYLAVYDRQIPAYSAPDMADLEQQWRAGAVNVVTVMSVESLTNLIAILPAWCETELENTPLVTPASRVIKEALDRFPGIPTTLARGPQASEIVDAIVNRNQT
jgi:uroporphyrinogen-III synthase